MDDETTSHEIFATFAEHLVPEAFATPTRAHRVTRDVSGPIATDRVDARLRFDRWIDARIEDALAATWPHDKPLIVAFTSDGQLLRRYDENGCGHIGCVVAMVQREVTMIATPWVFGAALPRPQPRWEVIYDDDGDEVDELLIPPSTRRWVARWYAEARGGGVADTFAGYLQMNAEEVTSAGPLDVRASETARGFHRILHRHPARRRYPLRRR
jgi:hypothetical protein